MDGVLYGMQMEMFMRESGSMTRHMVRECILISTELSTKASGRRISSMDMVTRPGEMAKPTKDNTSMVSNTAREFYVSPINHTTKDNSCATKSTGTDITYGTTLSNTMDSGSITKCMARV